MPDFRGRFFPSRFTVLRIAVCCAFLPSAFAQLPLIYARSVYNSASYLPAGIPGGGIAQGSIFSFFGANMGPPKGVSASSYPLSNTLSGVSLNIIQGNTTVPAIPIYVSATQINAIMPSTAPPGQVSLQVIYNNARSNKTPVNVTSAALGIFTALGTGQGPGALLNYVTASDQPINYPKNSAQPGQVITLYGTGLGPITGPDNAQPPVGNLPVKVEVFVASISAQVSYSGRAPGFAGEDQIDFTIPNNAPLGCWVPVYVRLNGTVVSNFVSIAISSKAGGTCSNAVLPPIANIFINGGGSYGAAIVARTNTVENIGVTAPVTVSADYHLSFAFTLPNLGNFPFNPIVTLPPPGICTVYNVTGDITNSNPPPNSVPAPPLTPLDLGPPFLLTGPNGMRSLTATMNTPFSVRSGELGGYVSNNILPSSLYLSPGNYAVTGTGGSGVGPFSTNFTIPQPLTWTNQSSISPVVRTQPLAINWTGGSSGDLIFIIGIAADLPSNSSSSFTCSVPAGASTLTIPSDIFANIPATRANPLQSKDVIYIMDIQGPSLQNLNATGLGYGVSASYLIDGQTVIFE